MAKDTRQILSGVRFGGTVYVDGMEDELAEKLDQKQLDRLIERGAIAGDFKAKAVTAATPKAVEQETAPAQEETASQEESAPVETKAEVKTKK